MFNAPVFPIEINWRHSWCSLSSAGGARVSGEDTEAAGDPEESHPPVNRVWPQRLHWEEQWRTETADFWPQTSQVLESLSTGGFCFMTGVNSSVNTHFLFRKTQNTPQLFHHSSKVGWTRVLLRFESHQNQISCWLISSKDSNNTFLSKHSEINYPVALLSLHIFLIYLEKNQFEVVLYQHLYFSFFMLIKKRE